MSKRARDGIDAEYTSHSKRSKLAISNPPYDDDTNIDRLSNLPDELILRILSFLSETELLQCHLLSHKYRYLCEDGDLWRALYYDNFVRPRVRRLRGSKDGVPGMRSLSYSRHANWLEDAYLLNPMNRTNWKRQFRLRHNWSNGNCTRHNIVLDRERGSCRPLVKLHDGRLYTVDERYGLRVWKTNEQQQLLVQKSLQDFGVASAVAVERDRGTDDVHIVVGFEDGKVVSFFFRGEDNTLSVEVVIRDDRAERVTLVQAMWPFVMIMTRSRCMSLYMVKEGKMAMDEHKEGPGSSLLIHRLESRLEMRPLCISVRPLDTGVSLSIAFTTHGIFGACTVGIQELRISHSSDEVSSRLYYADDEIHPLFVAVPTSMSYNHPYLLVSHADNTLTLYMVRSDLKSLSIGAGKRLWGHTSAVSYADVGPRGRAVSVSRTGGELRVWELEGGVVSNTARRRVESREMSVVVQPRSHARPLAKNQNAAAQDIEAVAAPKMANVARNGEVDVATKRQWVGFDEENVAVLEEGRNGEQMLVVYNFA